MVISLGVLVKDQFVFNASSELPIVDAMGAIGLVAGKSAARGVAASGAPDTVGDVQELDGYWTQYGFGAQTTMAALSELPDHSESCDSRRRGSLQTSRGPSLIIPPAGERG